MEDETLDVDDAIALAAWHAALDEAATERQMDAALLILVLAPAPDWLGEEPPF